ncbi:hypothetical protein ACFRMN_09335 [Streptomyces sp. NPDC056835]|uniref:hypothetical protein n=1 Tax=Streptomyces sp. NPDC056835 TaxID=3345956 RepID=UPI0036A8F6F8
MDTTQKVAVVTGAYGSFNVTRSVIGAMLSRDGGGHIVNISTSLVDNADARVTGALASLTRDAHEPHQVAAHSVCW